MANVWQRLLLIGALGLGSSAHADATLQPASTPAKADDQDSITHLGVHADVGIPDGAGVGVTYRLIPQLRGELGITTDFSKMGLRAGVVLGTGAHFITPNFTASYGHLFTGAKGILLQEFVGTKGFAAETIKAASYDYVSGQLGLDIGPPQRFQLFIRAGLSYVVAVAHDYQPVLRELSNDPTLEASDPILKIVIPSVSVGVVVYFF